MAVAIRLGTVIRLTWRRYRSSKMFPVVLTAPPLFLAFLWIRDSPETAGKFFQFLFPYIFLFFTQNLSGQDVESGALDNVVFQGGGFRRFLRLRFAAVVVVASAYALTLACFLAVGAALTGRSSGVSVVSLLMGLVIGLYYAGLGGLLSYFLRGGSNVLVVIVIQAGILIAFLLAATGHLEFLEALDTGRLPRFSDRGLFFFLAAAFPNILTIMRFWGWLWEIAVLLAAALVVQEARIRRLELSR